MLGSPCSPCCSSVCSTKWSDAIAVEVELELVSSFRETVAVSYGDGLASGGISYDYATQQICSEKYTGTFSLTQVGRSVALSSPTVLYKTHWVYNFGNGSYFNLYLTDDYNGGSNSDWAHIEWAMTVASLISWKRFSSPQSSQYPTKDDLCGDASIDFSYSTPVVFSNGSSKWSVTQYPKFLATSLQPPAFVDLGYVRTYCRDGTDVTEEQSYAFGGISQAVTSQTSYPLYCNSLMSTLQTSGGTYDRFALTSGSVSVLDHSPVDISGSVPCGSVTTKAINIYFA
jgi:hypothetical protein